jgi:hypothetical protein
MGNAWGWLKHELIDVAPAPVLARLEGLDDRMVGAPEVSGGMTVLGGVAAAHVAAGQALAKVDPGVAHRQALFASGGAGRHITDLIQVSAGGHGVSPVSLAVIPARAADVSPREIESRCHDLRIRDAGLMSGWVVGWWDEWPAMAYETPAAVWVRPGFWPGRCPQ